LSPRAKPSSKTCANSKPFLPQAAPRNSPKKTKAKGDFFKRWADGFLKLIDDNDLN